MKSNMEHYFKNNMWILKKDFESTKKIYKFTNFITAFSWMTEIVLNVEINNHHPE